MKRDTLLHVAARSGHLSTLQKVLSDERVNVDARNEHTHSALHVAAMHGSADACELLIKHGAHIFLTTGDGLTALHLATASNHLQCVSVLLKYGSNPYYTVPGGRTAVALISTPEMAECYLNFFSNTRRNPTLLQRLEKDLLWKDIDDLLSTAAYESLVYDEKPDEPEKIAKCGPPVLHAGSTRTATAFAVRS